MQRMHVHVAPLPAAGFTIAPCPVTATPVRAAAILD
jgi:hypothetical protein